MVWLLLLIVLLIINALVAMRDARRSARINDELRLTLNTVRDEAESCKQDVEIWRLKYQRVAITAYDRLDQIQKMTREIDEYTQLFEMYRKRVDEVAAERDTIHREVVEAREKRHEAEFDRHDKAEQLQQANLAIDNLTEQLDELKRELDLIRRSYKISEQDREQMMGTIMEVRSVIDAFLCSDSASARESLSIIVPEVSDGQQPAHGTVS